MDRGPNLLALTQARLKDKPSLKGVVLVGGYDVVPSQILIALPPELIKFNFKEADRMTVWSDDGYGDSDNKGIPKFPVSRIPDGASDAMLLKALSAPTPLRPTTRSGVRNISRPFAEIVYNNLAGSGAMALCEPARPSTIFSKDLIYFMLHGSWKDLSCFRGESKLGLDPNPIAVEIGDIPDPCAAVVFAGCCYGALTVDRTARETSPQDTVTPLPPETSLALTCLQRGANAFVGCTGVHYSPDRGNLKYLGEPFHRFFFEELNAGHPPSSALFQAKLRYAQGIPFRGSQALVAEAATEHKILRQFTCLGVGW